jgi:hypothetical protein
MKINGINIRNQVMRVNGMSMGNSHRRRLRRRDKE